MSFRVDENGRHSASSRIMSSVHTSQNISIVIHKCRQVVVGRHHLSIRQDRKQERKYIGKSESVCGDRDVRIVEASSVGSLCTSRTENIGKRLKFKNKMKNGNVGESRIQQRSLSRILAEYRALLHIPLIFNPKAPEQRK